VSDRLPVHGFVLAGGKSSRMGTDKAMLPVGGVPMVQIAVEKLRSFCSAVSIAGNRDDLASFAPVVHERRLEAGPAAGIEAGLRVARESWAMFVPVDVPLVPAELLRRWAVQVVSAGEQLVVSHLRAQEDQATFCMLRAEVAAGFTEVLNDGERKLTRIFDRAAAGGLHVAQDVSALYGDDSPGDEEISRWFMNVNTAEDLVQVGRTQVSRER